MYCNRTVFKCHDSIIWDVSYTVPRVHEHPQIFSVTFKIFHYLSINSLSTNKITCFSKSEFNQLNIQRIGLEVLKTSDAQSELESHGQWWFLNKKIVKLLEQNSLKQCLKFVIPIPIFLIFQGKASPSLLGDTYQTPLHASLLKCCTCLSWYSIQY